MMRSLIAEIQALADGGSLNQGQADSLIAKLNTAIQNLDSGLANTALNNLDAFSNEVQALVAAGVLTPEEGQSLLEAVEAIMLEIQVRYEVS
jgi:hypothetical protein